MGRKRRRGEGWGRGGAERTRRKGKEPGDQAPAHQAFPAEHLKEALVLMVLQEAGRNVLSRSCSGPRPASHRAPTHGSSVLVLSA